MYGEKREGLYDELNEHVYVLSAIRVNWRSIEKNV